MIKNFDLIVIGGGTGLDIANAAASKGLKVALVEKDMLGGTCLNRGCIPSKLLIHSADVVQLIRKASTFGISTRVSDLDIDFQRIVERVNKITDNESNTIRDGILKSKNPVLFTQECYFVGHKELVLKKSASSDRSNEKNKRKSNKGDEQVEGNGKVNDAIDPSFGPPDSDENRIRADKIVIATGTVPKIPKINGLVDSGYITSDEALRLKKQPQTITFIGGGYIACELAHFFGSLGSKINIIQRNNLLIPNEDKEISERFTKIFSGQYQIYLGYNTELVSKVSNNGNISNEKFRIVARNKKDNGRTIEIDSEQLVICTGRRPNSSILNLEKTGVEVDKDGFIKVNEYLQTTTPGIFALGDVVGRYQFKHNANLEAQYLYHNLFVIDSNHDSDDNGGVGIHDGEVVNIIKSNSGGNISNNNNKSKSKTNKKKMMIKVDYTAMPHAIFSFPQVAAVGFTEQELKIKKINYLESVFWYIDTGMGLAIDDKEGFVKFLVNKENRKILGCHILGTDASTLIHEVLVSMRTGDGTIDSISNTIHIHPALSEVVERAASSIDG